MSRSALQAVPSALVVHRQPGVGHEDPESSSPPAGGAATGTDDGKKGSVAVMESSRGVRGANNNGGKTNSAG